MEGGGAAARGGCHARLAESSSDDLMELKVSTPACG
jgi:hypothetical protein